MTGEYVLGGALPRTWVPSGLELDVLSAAIRHEEALPRQTAIHLFSDLLPAKRWALSWLREQKADGDDDGLMERLKGWNQESARQDLFSWTDAQTPTGEVLGQGLRLGGIQTKDDLSDPRRLQEILPLLAGAYLAQENQFRVPYYDLSQ